MNNRENIRCVLLVDDEQMIRRAGMRILNRVGCEVMLAESGARALEIYRAAKDRIDVVILDMTMPEMDGTACLAELRQIDPSVRVVLSSGSMETLHPELSVPEGADGVLPKPYNADQLRSVFDKIFPTAPTV